MSNSEARAKIVEIIAEQLNWPVETAEAEIQRGASFVEMGFDSLDSIETLMTIEDVFDIEIDESGPEFAAAEGMKVSDFLDLALPMVARRHGVH